MHYNIIAYIMFFFFYDDFISYFKLHNLYYLFMRNIFFDQLQKCPKLVFWDTMTSIYAIIIIYKHNFLNGPPLTHIQQNKYQAVTYQFNINSKSAFNHPILLQYIHHLDVIRKHGIV